MNHEILNKPPPEEAPIQQHEVEYLLEDCQNLYGQLLEEASFNYVGNYGEVGFTCLSSRGGLVSNPCLPYVTETNVWVPLAEDRKLIIHHMNPKFLEEGLGEWLVGYENAGRMYWVVFLNADNCRALASEISPEQVKDVPPERADFDCLKGMMLEVALMKGYVSG